MATKVLSIELGQSITKICEIDFKVKVPKVYHCIEVATPEGALEDGYVVKPKELAGEMLKEIKNAGIKTKKAVFAISSGKIASREATLPYVKANKLPEMVQAAAGDYFPVDLSECKVTYEILDTPEAEDGTKRYRLSLLIAPNDLLESYYTLADEAGLDIVALDHNASSVATVLNEEFKQEGVRMAINVTAVNTQLFVYDEGNIVLSRTIPAGVGYVIDTVQEREQTAGRRQITYKEAVEVLRSKPCIRTEADTAAKAFPTQDVPSDDYREAVTDAIGNMGASILRVMDYYNSRNVDRVIERVFMTGMAEDFLGFDEYLSEELGIRIEKLSDGDKVIDFGSVRHIGTFIACVGAAMDPLDLIPDAHLDKKKKKTRKKAEAGEKTETAASQGLDGTKMLLIGIAVMLIGFAGAGGLAALSILPYQKAEAENKELKEREAELLPILKVYRDSVRADLAYDDVKKMYGATETQNDNLYAFMQELERKLPMNVNVLSFSATQESVTLNMNVDSKEAAAKTIDEFRKFNSLLSVHVGGLSEDVDEAGMTSVVNFTISCTYAPIIHEEEEEKPGQQEAPAEAADETELEEE